MVLPVHEILFITLHLASFSLLFYLFIIFRGMEKREKER